MNDHDLLATGPVALLRLDGTGTIVESGPTAPDGPLRTIDGTPRHGSGTWLGAPLVEHAAPSQREALRTWLDATGTSGTAAEPFLWRARCQDSVPLVMWLHAVGKGEITAQRAGGPIVGPNVPLPSVPPRLGADHVLNHDVRAGLRSARSFLGVHARRRDEPASDELATVARSLAATDQLVDGLVRFHRLGSDPVSVRRVALADVIVQAARQAEDTLADLASSSAWADLAGGFVVHGPGRNDVDGDLHGDESLLEWLVAELCLNARKFAGPTVVSVSATADGPWITVRLGNTGEPIDRDLGEEAFLLGRLLQGRHERPGVGIGLPTCRRIATRHAGRLRFVEPTEEDGGTGTVLELELPLVPTPTTGRR